MKKLLLVVILSISGQSMAQVYGGLGHYGGFYFEEESNSHYLLFQTTAYPEL